MTISTSIIWHTIPYSTININQRSCNIGTTYFSLVSATFKICLILHFFMGLIFFYNIVTSIIRQMIFFYLLFSTSKRNHNYINITYSFLIFQLFKYYNFTGLNIFSTTIATSILRHVIYIFISIFDIITLPLLCNIYFKYHNFNWLLNIFEPALNYFQV